MPIPTGIITLWYGSIASIPSGWTLCNGSNGTPDLRNKFIVGAGDTYDPADTGGAAQHTHNFTGDGHSHTLQSGALISAGAARSNQSTTVEATGTTNNGSSLPPYHSLAYIMKL